MCNGINMWVVWSQNISGMESKFCCFKYQVEMIQILGGMELEQYRVIRGCVV